jgi:hypothetical protein
MCKGGRVFVRMCLCVCMSTCMYIFVYVHVQRTKCADETPKNKRISKAMQASNLYICNDTCTYAWFACGCMNMTCLYACEVYSRIYTHAGSQELAITHSQRLHLHRMCIHACIQRYKRRNAPNADSKRTHAIHRCSQEHARNAHKRTKRNSLFTKVFKHL